MPERYEIKSSRWLSCDETRIIGGMPKRSTPLEPVPLKQPVPHIPPLKPGAQSVKRLTKPGAKVRAKR